MKKVNVVLLVAVFICMSMITAQANEKEIVAGAGPSTKVVRAFMTEFANEPVCAGITFEVPPKSVKHAGGIKCSDHNLFGRTGRPLNKKEKKLGKSEIFLAKVPIAFVTGPDAGVSQLNLADLEKIYTRKVTNWKEVGGSDAAIVLAGREPTEALYLELKMDYAFFLEAKFDVVLNKDNHIISFMKSIKGRHAIAFGAKPNFNELNIVDVAGFTSGTRLGLVYDKRNQANPVVNAAMVYAKSDTWQKHVEQAGLIALY